jgi:hypothetical protein
MNGAWLALLLTGCGVFTRVAVGPTWQSAGGAKGFGVVVNVAGTLTAGDCEDFPPLTKAQGGGITGGLESALQIASPQLEPLGGSAGIEGASVTAGRWAAGFGGRVSASWAAPPSMFVGRGALYLDFTWFRNKSFYGFGLEGGIQFGLDSAPAGFVSLPFAFRRFSFPSCC